MNEAVGMPAASNNYNISTMFLEAASKIVLGKSPVDSFEEFVKEWREARRRTDGQGTDGLVKRIEVIVNR